LTLEAQAAQSTGKREAILDAALELFSERGFHGTAVPRVADRARVGAGTLYRYFASKEALVNAVYQNAKLMFGQALLAGFDANATIRSQFHNLWFCMLDFVRAHPKHVAFLELHHHASYIDEESRRIEAAVIGPIKAFIIDAQEKQIIKAVDPEVVIAVTYGSFVGLLKRSWEGKVELTREILESAENCVWEAIRA
jgi:AcrR family transcriptional regulator